MRQFVTLFKPLTIKGLTLRNRIVFPAMNTNFAEADGSVNDRFTKFYVERGKGGAGLLIVSPGYIDPSARKRHGSLLYNDDRFVPKLAEFVKAIHKTGARVIQQLNHNGRLLTSPKGGIGSTGLPVGPSAIPHLSTGEIPKVLNIEEINEIVEKFAQSARRAKEAGFDGVELHGAHGYLLHQFFSPYSNRRTDEYGGSPENRMRFPLEIYRRTRELTGRDFLISYRLNARDFTPIEAPFADVVKLCQCLEEEGIDLIGVSVGSSETPSMVLRMIPPGSMPRGCYVELAASIKENVKVPIIAVGRISTPEVAEITLRDGKADLVAIGRGLIADPYWPEKAFNGEADRIRRCIGCYQGCYERLIKEEEVTCLYNPEVGHEGENVISPASKRKKVWVVGGGPAGMEAAVVASLRGHDVELYEKGNELGGQCLLAAISPGKEEFSGVRDFLLMELKRLKVAIHLNEEISATGVIENQPDVVIVATGSRPLIPKIPGIRGKNVVTAWEVLRGKQVGEKVIVGGGGVVGVETALFLSKQGKQVLLIEMLDDIAHDAGTLNRARLEQALKETNIEVKCRTKLLEIKDRWVIVQRDSKKYDIPAETVVLALGAEAQDSLQHSLMGKVSELHVIGDCVAPRKMIEAIHEAYNVASKI